MGNQYIAEMKNINKSFSGVQVLHDVSLSIKPSEVRALVGENGAGKSTLIKILGGIHSSDSGEVFIDGKKKVIQNVQDAQESGIAIIHQEIFLIKPLTIAENIFLGREPMTKANTVNFKKMYKESAELLETFGMGYLDPRTMVKDLSISQQQMIEILRALSTNARIIVMDEPTSSLTEHEVDYLFEQIKKLKEAKVAILYISHKMDEIFRITDSITILRDGRHIYTNSIAETNYEKIINSMVGHEIKDYYAKSDVTIGEDVLEIKNLTNRKVKDVSFSIRKGEILGFAGLVGAGRTELARAIFGVDSFSSGNIMINGKKIKINNPQNAIDNGIALVPEDRKAHGLFLSNTIAFNMTITMLKNFMRFIFINRKREKEILDTYINSLSIKMASTNQLVIELSGGNQQKVVISKWLASKPQILILDEPTRGVDVGAKSEIYHLMSKITALGVSIIMISSELPEILNLSNRIAVMHEGELVKIFNTENEEITQEMVMHYATGGYKHE